MNLPQPSASQPLVVSGNSTQEPHTHPTHLLSPLENEGTWATRQRVCHNRRSSQTSGEKTCRVSSSKEYILGAPLPSKCLAATTFSMLIMQILSELPLLLLAFPPPKKKCRKLTVIAAGQFASSTIKI